MLPQLISTYKLEKFVQLFINLRRITFLMEVNSEVFVVIVLQTVEQWEREKKARADVEKVKRKIEGDLKVRCRTRQVETLRVEALRAMSPHFSRARLSQLAPYT